MAMTASLACSPTTVRAGPNGKVACTLTVSNSGAVDVNVTGIHPRVQKNGAGDARRVANVSAPPITPANALVAAAGSAKFFFDVVFHWPLTESNATIDIDADVFCDDGTSPVVTAVAITVSKANV
jgi:hypothetical protein